MKVCIGITTKNRAAILPEAIQSALDQSYQHKEVLVFDDGSTDFTPHLAEKYPGVKWLREEKSIGLMAARNKMMKFCDADLFVSLDDDAWFLSGDEVSIAVDIMNNDQKVGALAFDILQKNSKRYAQVSRQDYFETNMYIGCGHVLRLSAVQDVGYYVPFPFKYGHEEKDLCIRLIDKGFKVLFLPGVHVWHDSTIIERNIPEQHFSFVVNDLIFPFRRVSLQFLIPVLLTNMSRKFRSKEGDRKLTRLAIWKFITLIPSDMKNVKRVKTATYRKYYTLSKRFMAYLEENNQAKC